MTRFLTREGFRVSTASSGEQGLRLAREAGAADTPGQAAALAAVEATGGRLVSAFVRATKPARTA
jgi:hypothetical protein